MSHNLIMFALCLAFLFVLLISVGQSRSNETVVDCFGHEVLYGNSPMSVADLEHVSYINSCAGTSMCWKVIQSKDEVIESGYLYDNEDLWRKISVSWKGHEIKMATALSTSKAQKEFTEKPVTLEIECRGTTLIVKENECSQRGENVRNWRLIYHQFKPATKAYVTSDPLDNYFRNVTNMEEFHIGSRPFEFVLQWDNLLNLVTSWQMWSQKSDPTLAGPVLGYTDIDVNYPEHFNGLEYNYTSSMSTAEMHSGNGYLVGVRNNYFRSSFSGPYLNSSLKAVYEVFLHVRVFPLCKFYQGNHWNNIHTNCKADGTYESELCKVCGMEEYEEKICTETENTVCKKCKTCSLDTEYVDSPCNSKSDTVCVRCSRTCTNTQYVLDTCANKDLVRCGNCHLVCAANQYIKEKCEKDGYFQCEYCSKTCGENQYIEQKCTATKDIVCSRLGRQSFNFILIIIICCGILLFLGIVLIVGFVHRRRKRQHNDNGIYSDPKTYIMTENLWKKDPTSLLEKEDMEKENNGSSGVYELQYEHFDGCSGSSLYSSLNVQNPAENADAYTSINNIVEPTYETQGSEYSSLNGNVNIVKENKYAAINTDNAVSGDDTAYNIIESGNYSVLSEEIQTECEYSALNENSGKELYSTMDEANNPSNYYSPCKDDNNYANLSVDEDDDTAFYSDVAIDRIDYASIKVESKK